MSRSATRRGGLDLVGDAVDRLRGDWTAATLLHVLPSVPFFVGAVSVAVAVDLRGALPEEGTTHLALLWLLKIPGWAALAAWAGAAARGRPLGVAGAWRRVAARLPETLLAGAAASAAFVAGAFTLIGFALLAPAAVALAAATGETPAGARASFRRGLSAGVADLDRAIAILFTSILAGLLLVLNLVVLLPVLLALGAGGLGLDLELLSSAFGLSRFGTWTFAGCAASLVVEAFAVAAFAELDADREAEREGVRFEQFADELEARDAAAPRPAEARA